MISLDTRLLACADFVSGKGIACDVGTDHAYLAVYLIESGKCSQVIASDINDGPLDFARRTIEKHECYDKIKLVKSDGLKEIDGNGVTDVIIAGMGAETICKIIDDAEWLKNGVNLVLQPMTKAHNLREWLYLNGFEIISEKAVLEYGFAYSVMSARYSGIRKKIDSFKTYTGELDFTDEQSKTYLALQARRLKLEGEALLNASVDDALAMEKIEIAKEIMDIIEGEKL
ncbi:MAG: SAM-dependent methyltransferase [Clostridiales bacterium]|nr:SAM-dependent methyltransferase [Clostridiales bacterium]